MDIVERIHRTDCWNFVCEGNQIWFPWVTSNGLCHIDTESHQVKLLERFGQASIGRGFLYSSVHKIGCKLILVPQCANRIAVYDLQTESTAYLEIRNYETGARKEEYAYFHFWVSIAYGRFVYMFGYSYPAIVKLNVFSMQIEYLTGWVDELESKIAKEKDNRGYFNDGEVIGHTAWIPCGCVNSLLKLDLLTDQWELVRVDTSVSGFGGLAYDGRDFWIVGRGLGRNRVVCWNQERGVQREFVFEEKDIEGPANAFWRPVITEKWIYLFPYEAGHAYRIDRNSGESSLWGELDELFAAGESGPGDTSTLPHRLGDKILFVTVRDAVWHEYDVRNSRLCSYEARIEFDQALVDEKLGECFSEITYEAQDASLEGRRMPLRQYLKCIGKYLGTEGKPDFSQIFR